MRQTAGPDDGLTEVAGRLGSAKIGALPIVERGKLLGLVTVTDVLAAEVQSAMGPASITQAIAADAMTPFPVTIGPDSTLERAVAIMVDRHVRHLPVVDSASNIVGIVSERDVRTAIGDPLHYLELRGRLTAKLRVADIMSRPAVVVPFDQPLVEIARAFADKRIGALPVVDKFGALVGIVSYVDALRALAG